MEFAGAWKAESLRITALTQDIAILLALAVLGGVPPLVHLRRERISG